MSMKPKSDHANIIVPPPVLYAVPLALGVFLDWKVRALPLLGKVQARHTGEVAMTLGSALVVWSFLQFFLKRTSPVPIQPANALIVEGPFRWTRNPLYLALAILYVGVAFLANTLWPFFFFPLVLFAVDFFVINREEAYLERRFGEEYREYRSRVRRWV
jgi:protein-S-isoprenylcysteine O-methyltransferase Ste14